MIYFQVIRTQLGKINIKMHLVGVEPGDCELSVTNVTTPVRQQGTIKKNYSDRHCLLIFIGKQEQYVLHCS